VVHTFSQQQKKTPERSCAKLEEQNLVYKGAGPTLFSLVKTEGSTYTFEKTYSNNNHKTSKQKGR